MVSKDFREISASHTHLDKRGRKFKSKLRINLYLFFFYLSCYKNVLLGNTQST